MKKFLLLIFTLFSLSLSGTTWYVSTTGSDANPGTIGSPWRTLWKATTTVTTPGDKIHVVAGTYSGFYNDKQCTLALGVTLEGEGSGTSGTVFICPHITGDGNWNAFLMLNSGDGNTIYNGNQTVSDIRFDGNGTVCDAAIYVYHRENVTVEDCYVTNFFDYGIKFIGQPTWATGRGTEKIEPTIWADGNICRNNTVINCSSSSGTDGATGCIGIGAQRGMLCYGNTINANGRSSGYAGYGIKASTSGGWNQGLKIYNSTITMPLPTTSVPFKNYSFGIEAWYWYNECEVYNCTVVGSLDICYTNPSPGYDYSVSMHDNIISRPSFHNVEEYGILCECKTSDVLIYNNYIYQMPTGIMFHQFTGCHEVGTNTVWNNIDIYNNELINLGASVGSGYGVYGIRGHAYHPPMSGSTDVRIWNNSIVATTSGSSKSPSVGVYFPDGCNSSAYDVTNNIIMNWDVSALYGDGAYTMTGLDFIYNVCYNNTDNDIAVSGGYTFPGKTESNNITTNPLLADASSDAHLTLGSPAIGHGTTPTLSAQDKDGVYWLTSPASGAYEFSEGYSAPTVTTSAISSITETTATGGGNVTSDGGGAVTDRGICWDTSTNPTVSDSHTHDGTGTGVYVSYITGLTAGLTYYVRAYAINGSGTSYGSERSFVTTSTPLSGTVFVKNPANGQLIKSGTKLVKIGN